MKVVVLKPHGFCAGVTAALAKARALLDEAAGEKVYCLHELVHNELVVRELKERGMVFVETLAEAPRGARLLFSAHGVSPALRREAEARGLRTVDATCPFVTRVHNAARAFAERGLKVVIIGNPNHAEVKGILGEIEGFTPTSERLGVVSQTTMNADEVRERVAELRRGHDLETMADVCNATKERQDAVKSFAGDALLVLGSENSSNTKRLCEIARCRAFRAGTMEAVRALDLSGVCTLGVTSGASTPETFFNAALEYLTNVVL